MKAFALQNSFGLSNLCMVEVDDLPLQANEVKIKFQSQSINYRDLLMIEGLYNPRIKLPLIPLSDGSGVVCEVAPGISQFQVNDKVSPIFVQNWFQGKLPSDAMKYTLGGPLRGTLSEYGVYNVDNIVKIPNYLSFEEAAALPCAALTAWSALVTHAQIKKNDYVLILGTGGVALFALQIAKAFGAKTIITSSKKDKFPLLTDLGASHIIDRKQYPNWSKVVREITGKQGVDIVVELGGPGTLQQSIQAVQNGGHISLIGVLSNSNEVPALLPVIMRNITIQGILVGNKKQYVEMNEFFTKHKLRPIIDQAFSFAQSLEALQYLKSQSHFGKVCIH